MNLSFEFYGELIPLLAGNERLTLNASRPPATVADALVLLADHWPALQPRLDRCAVVCGTEVLLRSDPVPTSGQLALLPPVAGG